jgi:hypothetical protein
VKKLLACALALLAGAAAAQDLFLAPGKSLTILDAADPAVRVVVTAPQDAPLDLSSILVTDPKDRVSSIVTRMQVEPARALSRDADGSLSLEAKPHAEKPGRRMLQGGVLVFSAGKYVYHPENDSTIQESQAPALPQRGRLLISKRGVSQAQAERDIARCRRYADDAGAQFLRSADKVAAYNSAMHACLKNFGYAIHSPAA